MKISKIIFSLAIGSMIIVTSCKDANTKTETTEELGHEHDADGNHKEDKAAVGQEEFNVNDTSENKVENSVTNEQSNTATIVVKANKALEYKFKVNQYEKLEYEWNADAPLRYDFHGDPEDKDGYPQGYFESYANGTSDAAKGKVTLPYKGSHGWYWKNTSSKDITITLTTKGNYNIIGIIQ
ncbi:MAG: hypothetical protein ACJAZ3_001841 [Sphingobacteriales bacterium]|jgi:hypothetical protein